MSKMELNWHKFAMNHNYKNLSIGTKLMIRAEVTKNFTRHPFPRKFLCFLQTTLSKRLFMLIVL